MSITPGKPIYRRPQRPEEAPQNVAAQMAIKTISGMAEYLADAMKTHQQAFSELGVSELLHDAGMQLANAVARMEAKK